MPQPMLRTRRAVLLGAAGAFLANLPPTRTTFAATRPAQRRVRLVAEAGDTLASLMDDAGVPASDIAPLIRTLATVFEPRSLQPGHAFDLWLEDGDSPRLLGLTFDPDSETTLRIERHGDAEFRLQVLIARLSRALAIERGAIQSSLFEAMELAGTPASIIMGLIRVVASAVDLQRDLQPGDRFTLLRERLLNDRGIVVREGAAILIELQRPGVRHVFFRFAPQGREADWYDEAGQSVRRAFLRTPLAAARVSSGFGMRKHPILGFSRMHQGVDFAAPTGTPVYAAADGTVSFAGTRGAYGRLVELSHAGGVRTRYAHMHRIASAMRSGARVRQGQVIGSVGSTGLSTGPHLHFELIRNGQHMDPSTIRTLGAVRLAGRELVRFRAELAAAEATVRSAPRQQLSQSLSHE